MHVTSGTFNLGDEVTLKVDKSNRMAISRNHSATHLLHKALKEVLGAHVAQAGSLVTADRLRFDFSHFEAMTPEQTALVEDKVNEAILSCMPITVQELPIDEAKKLGAEAQFGEKYGAVVRVVSMGDYSVEFLRRYSSYEYCSVWLVQACFRKRRCSRSETYRSRYGQSVMDYIKDRDALIERTAVSLKTNQIHEIDKKAQSVIAENKSLEKTLEEIRDKMAAMRTKNMLAGIKHLGTVNVLTAQVDGMSVNEMKALADSAKSQMNNGVIVLAANTDGKITFIAMAMKEAVKQGIHCGNIIKELTAICGRQRRRQARYGTGRRQGRNED